MDNTAVTEALRDMIRSFGLTPSETSFAKSVLEYAKKNDGFITEKQTAAIVRMIPNAYSETFAYKALTTHMMKFASPPWGTEKPSAPEQKPTPWTNVPRATCPPPWAVPANAPEREKAPVISEKEIETNLSFTNSLEKRLERRDLNRKVQTVSLLESSVSGSLHITTATITGSLQEVELHQLVGRVKGATSVYVRLSDIQYLLETGVELKEFYETYNKPAQAPGRWQRVKTKTGASIIRAGWSAIGAGTAALYFLNLVGG